MTRARPSGDGLSFLKQLRFGALALDTVARSASVDGRPVALSRREMQALEYRMRRAGNAVPKHLLEDRHYGLGEDGTLSAVELLIPGCAGACRRSMPT